MARIRNNGRARVRKNKGAQKIMEKGYNEREDKDKEGEREVIIRYGKVCQAMRVCACSKNEQSKIDAWENA